MCDCCCINSLIYGIGVFAILSKIIPWAVKKYKGDKKPELMEPNYKKDVVYLFQFTGNETVSSISPFCIKIEAYMRLNNIKFERRNTMAGRGTNGKLPCIELNGEQVADSQIILLHLSKHFNIKDYDGNAEKTAYGRAIGRMADNHTFHVLMNYKKGAGGCMLKAMGGGHLPPIAIQILTPLVSCFFKNKVSKSIANSIGSFKEEQFKELLHIDFTALQTILGNKKFLLGDAPTPADCTVFSQIAAVHYMAPEEHNYVNELMTSVEFAPLKEYMARFRDTVFKGDFHA